MLVRSSERIKAFYKYLIYLLLSITIDYARIKIDLDLIQLEINQYNLSLVFGSYRLAS